MSISNKTLYTLEIKSTEFINTIAHEAKHVQSHICKYYKVDEDSEEAAYLMGYIIMKMYNKFKDYICDL